MNQLIAMFNAISSAWAEAEWCRLQYRFAVARRYLPGGIEVVGVLTNGTVSIIIQDAQGNWVQFYSLLGAVSAVASLEGGRHDQVG